MFVLTLALARAGATPAESATPDSTNPATESAKPAKPKKTCKRIVMTGSNLGRRICKTEEQWIAEQSANIDNVNQSYKQNIGNDPAASMGRGN
ncbi:MAG: hypothetical protein KAF42_00935 [Sphingopyxis terrae]|nr:hypothetical protein [Sphingopyxis terrae]